MRRGIMIVIGIAVVLWLASMAEAQTGILCPGWTTAELQAIGYESLTVSSTAVALTVPNETVLAIAGVEDADVRFLDTGDVPTASVGRKAIETSELLVCRRSLKVVQFIRAASTDAVLRIVYYGR